MILTKEQVLQNLFEASLSNPSLIASMKSNEWLPSVLDAGCSHIACSACELDSPDEGCLAFTLFPQIIRKVNLFNLLKS